MQRESIARAGSIINDLVLSEAFDGKRDVFEDLAHRLDYNFKVFRTLPIMLVDKFSFLRYIPFHDVSERRVRILHPTQHACSTSIPDSFAKILT